MNEECDRHLSIHSTDVSRYFRDQLREARASILKDSEAYESAVVVFERIGRWLRPSAAGLGMARDDLRQVAELSILSKTIPALFPNLHLQVKTLIDLIRDGRNAAVHEGALARNVTTHCVELALMLEDALMVHARTIGELMVRTPVSASPWFPVSYVRQLMLKNSFSYLPVKMDDGENGTWLLVSDTALANFLGAIRGKDRDHRLRKSLKEVSDSGELTLDRPRCLAPDFDAAKLKNSISATPILVIEPTSNELLGIVTAFDVI